MLSFHWLSFKYSGGALTSHTLMTGRMINEVILQVPLSSLYESEAGLMTESPAGSSLGVRAGPHGLRSARPSRCQEDSFLPCRWPRLWISRGPEPVG